MLVPENVMLAFKVQDSTAKNCETGPYFLQNFQCTTIFVSVYCKICELKTKLKTEHEITFAADVTAKVFRTISGSQMGSQMGSQLLQNKDIIKRIVVLTYYF